MLHQFVPALAAALGASTPSADGVLEPIELRFAPPVGTRLERSVVHEGTFVGGDLSVIMDGNEIPAEFLPDLTIEVDEATEVTFVDRYVAPDDTYAGRPLVRTFEVAEQELTVAVDFGGYQGMEDFSAGALGRSPLVREAIRLGRDQEGELLAAWEDADQEQSAAVLAGLRPEVDLASWLPDGPIPVGARWSAEAQGLAELLDPSGELAWAWDGELADDAGAEAEVAYSGEVELHLEEISRIEDVEVARIRVSGSLVVVTKTATDLDDVPVADGTATEVMTATHALEGELLWNLDLGVLHALDLESTAEAGQVMTRDAGQPGPDYESAMSFEGGMKLTVRTKLVVD